MAQCCANLGFLAQDESLVVLIVFARTSLRISSNLAHAKSYTISHKSFEVSKATVIEIREKLSFNRIIQACYWTCISM